MRIVSDFLWRITVFSLRHFIFKKVKIETRGIENIPKKSFVIVANHDHPWDPPIITCIMHNALKKKTHFFTGKFLFKGIVGCYLRWIEQIAVQSGLRETNELAFKKSRDYLKRGDIVGIFPYPFDIIKKKKTIYSGIVRLLQENNVDFLPVHVKVYEKWKWKSYYSKNFEKVVLNIGKPIDNFIYGKKISKKDKLKITKKIMGYVNKLKF